ncbi:unnamed protein product [Moritella viscosa]|nr:unnamed protein product [Moritella viscosa]
MLYLLPAHSLKKTIKHIVLTDYPKSINEDNLIGNIPQ